MRIVEQRAIILDKIDGDAVLKKLEACGRVCYKSEGKTKENSAKAFVGRLVASGHESVLEHVSVTVKFICDRGISHEIVRHRLASYSQESTRYCKYQDEIVVIAPVGLNGLRDYQNWKWECRAAEKAYIQMLNHGVSAQTARAVLPTCLKTELIMTANLREWRHFFKMRCSPAAHPQVRLLAGDLLRKMQERIPVVFDDLSPYTGGEEKN